MLRIVIAVILISCTQVAASQTKNFVAATSNVTQDILDIAEAERSRLFIYWSGEDQPAWGSPCTVSWIKETGGAGGATRFKFDQGQVFDWRMTVQGTHQALTTKVLSHEVDHMVRATLTRRKTVRWLDEGLASLQEKNKEDVDHFTSRLKGMPVSSCWKYLNSAEYPTNSSEVETLYGFGASLTQRLMEKHGKDKLLELSKTGAALSTWRDILGETQEESKQDWVVWYRGAGEKPIFRIVGASWCAPCNALKADYARRSHEIPIAVTYVEYTPDIHGKDVLLPMAISPNGDILYGASLDGVISWANRLQVVAPADCAKPSGRVTGIPRPPLVKAPPPEDSPKDIPDSEKTRRIYQLEQELASLTRLVNSLKQDGIPQSVPSANGKDGSNGRDGVNGKAGKDGIDGKPGSQGIQGLPGKPGSQGIQGLPGKPGSFSGDVEIYTKNSAGDEIVIQKFTVRDGEPLRIYLPPIGLEMVDAVIDKSGKILKETVVAKEVYGRHQDLRLRFKRQQPEQVQVGE